MGNLYQVLQKARTTGHVKTRGRTAAAFGAVLFMLLAVTTAVPQNATAAPVKPSTCDSGIWAGLTNKNIGTEVPVILVHGMGNYAANATAWGSTSNASSFAGKVDRIPGVAVAHIFRYDTSVWVDQVSGSALAKTIDCVSELSKNNQSKGKVIVVGYSMGGLVARDALSRRSADNQRAIADQVGQVVTIGTPHVGAKVWTWSVFNAGSPEMTRLPKFPERTIVHTIASNVTNVTTDLWGNTTRVATNDDTIVTTSSAHDPYTIDVHKGGGQKTIACDKYFANWFGIIYETGKASCQHDQMVGNPFNGVSTDTVEAIKKYVAFLNLPPAPESFTAGPITVSFDSRWANYGYGAAGPNRDIIGNDLTNAPTCTNCQDTPPPNLPASLLISHMQDWCIDRTMQECITQSMGQPSEPAPAVTVGGRTPDWSGRYGMPNYHGSRLFWCFETEKVCVDYGTGADTYLLASQALRDLLTAATWATPQ